MNYFIEGIIGAITLGVFQFILGIIIPILTMPITALITQIERSIRNGYIPVYNTLRIDHFINYTLINICSILLAYYLFKMLPWAIEINFLAVFLTSLRFILSYEEQNGFWYEFSVILGVIVGLIIGFLLISKINTTEVFESPTESTNESQFELSTTNFRIQDKIKLTEAQNGIDGELQLLIDKSIPEHVESMVEILNSEGEIPQNAILIIVTNSNEVISSETLERSLAWFESDCVIKNDHSWIALTVDYSAGMGSYNGPITSFIRVKNSMVHRMTVTDEIKNKIDTIFLMKSLKTDWQISGKDGSSIYTKACRPNFDSNNGDFEITYTRFYLERNQWRRESFTENGFWETSINDQISIENEFFNKFKRD